MTPRDAALLLLLVPAPAVAGGPDELYASGPGECVTLPRPQRHRHDVTVTLDEEPLTEGVHVVVVDGHAGVRVAVDIGVTLPEEVEP